MGCRTEVGIRDSRVKGVIGREGCFCFFLFFCFSFSGFGRFAQSALFLPTLANTGDSNEIYCVSIRLRN